MAAKQTQISAVVSDGTKALLDRLTRQTGLKKAWVIETALSHYLHALAELPADVFVPPRVVVDRATWDRVADRIAKPPAATPAMRKLFEP